MESPSAPRPDALRSINLAEKLAGFTERWQPRTVAEFNGHDVMVVKAQGEFVWHKHDETDDLFLVLRGELTIELRDGSVTLLAGDLFVRVLEGRALLRGAVCDFVAVVQPRGPNDRVIDDEIRSISAVRQWIQSANGATSWPQSPRHWTLPIVPSSTTSAAGKASKCTWSIGAFRRQAEHFP